MNPLVLTSVEDSIAFLTLNRPESYNALDLATARDLLDHLLAARTDPAVHCVILSGAGKAFSAGGDIKRAMEHPHGAAAAFHELATFVHACVTEIRRMRKPVIAAINGIAAGGGFSLALACDFRVMAESARLRQSFTSNGLSIDAGGTFMLPRLVGLARALEIATFDSPITAQQAHTWGLANRVVADAAVVEEARRLAQSILERSLHSFGWSKALLGEAFNTSWEMQLEHERQGLTSCAAHADGLEGMRAFVEKRSARFNQ